MGGVKLPPHPFQNLRRQKRRLIMGNLCWVKRGLAKYTDASLFKIADMNGIKFIKLVYTGDGKKDMFAGNSLDFSVMGFQDVSIEVGEGGDGQKIYDFGFSKNIKGEDAALGRGLVFESNPDTERVEADCPDTPFNRKVLAATYFNNPRWRIVEETTNKEIREQAIELEKRQPKKDTKEETILALDSQLEKERAEKEALKKELETLRKASKVVDEARIDVKKAKDLVDQRKATTPPM
jgi:hypothetical protein